MIKFVLFLFSIFFSGIIYAACSDQPANEVDWTNCNFVENLDLIGVGLANAKMSGVNLSLANLEKSQINNSDLSIGNFIFANFSIFMRSLVSLPRRCQRSLEAETLQKVAQNRVHLQKIIAVQNK